MQNNINNVFQDAGKDLQLNPHPGTWGQLSNRLNKINGIRKKIRILNLSLKVAAAAIVLVNILWIGGFLKNQGLPPSTTQLEAYAPARRSGPTIYLPTDSSLPEGEGRTRTSHFTKAGIQARDERMQLENLVGEWLLSEEFTLSNAGFIPPILRIFHTADGHYYLQAGGNTTDAFLMDEHPYQNELTVLHPGIQKMSSANNTITLYLANGLILEYHKVPRTVLQ